MVRQPPACLIVTLFLIKSDFQLFLKRKNKYCHVFICLYVLAFLQAIRVAQNLFAASASFAVTNEPATGKVTVPLPLPRPKKGKGYKALVILNMAGGADTFVRYH